MLQIIQVSQQMRHPFPGPSRPLLSFPQDLPSSPGTDLISWMCSSCHTQKSEIHVRRTNDWDLFPLLASSCSQWKDPTNETSKMLPRSAPENWLSVSKARRAEPGKKRQGSHQRRCGDGAGHEWVWRKDTVTPWKTWKITVGITAGLQPALRCGVESEDQGRPSHFPWLFLSYSFDLFLRRAAETRGIESWCLAVAGDGARGLSHKSGGQDVTTPSPPAPPAPARREGGGQVRREEAAEISKSSLGQPALLPHWIVLF